MEKLKEFDPIITLVDKQGISKGTQGCIVHVYDGYNAYTCELFDADFNTIGVKDYEYNEIKKLNDINWFG